MSLSHSARAGESWADISRRFFGVPDHGPAIKAANPTLPDNIPQGAGVSVPDIQGQLASAEFVRDAQTDEVSVVLGTDHVQAWPNVSLEVSLDRFSQVRLSGPFEPDDANVRRVLDPTGYAPVSIMVGGVTQFRGVVVAVNPRTSADERTVSVLAYARAGVLQDCTPPTGLLPLEYTGQTLQQIARAMCQPFDGLGPVFPDGPGKPFAEVAADPDVPVLDFLRNLANKRGRIISNNTNGDPVFFKTPEFPSAPVASLVERALPLQEVRATFNTQTYFSHLSGFGVSNGPDQGEVATLSNPLLTNTLRPHSFVVQDAEQSTLLDAVKALQ